MTSTRRVPSRHCVPASNSGQRRGLSARHWRPGCCPCGHRDSPVCLCVYFDETMRGASSSAVGAMVTGRGYFPVGERGHRWLPESRPAVPSSATHMCTARQRHCLSPRRHSRACAAWRCSCLRRWTSRNRRPSKAEPLSIRHLSCGFVMGSPPAGRSHWIRPSTRPRATMWWLDLAYAPHLRPEGRRRLFALDAPRCLFC